MAKPYRAIFNEFQGGSFKPEDVDGSGDDLPADARDADSRLSVRGPRVRALHPFLEGPGKAGVAPAGLHHPVVAEAHDGDGVDQLEQYARNDLVSARGHTRRVGQAARVVAGGLLVVAVLLLAAWCRLLVIW